MKNKTVKILALICIMFMGFTCFVGCKKNQDSYVLTVINDSQYGIISPILDNETNSVTVDAGDNYTFTITPIEGYEIENLIIDGKLVEAQTIYSFTNINSDHSIGATYTKKIKSLNILAIKFNVYYKDSNNFNENGSNSKNIELSLFQIDNFKGMREDCNEVKIANFEEISIYVCRDYDHANGVVPIYGNKIEAQMNSPIKLNLYSDDNMLEIGSNMNHVEEGLDGELLAFTKEQMNRPNFYYENNQYLIEFDKRVNVYSTDGTELVLCNVSLICEANYYL